MTRSLIITFLILVSFPYDLFAHGGEVNLFLLKVNSEVHSVVKWVPSAIPHIKIN